MGTPQARAPDLLLEIVVDHRTRRADGSPLVGTPCLWYDQETRRCKHYEYRPLACREFEVGGDDCHDARRRAGMTAVRATVKTSLSCLSIRQGCSNSVDS